MSLLVKRPWPSGQPSVVPLPLNKGKAVVSYMPSLSQGDIHSLVEATNYADSEVAVESPAVEPSILAKPEAITKTPVHP